MKGGAIAVSAWLAAVIPSLGAEQPYAAVSKPLRIEQVPGTPIYYSIGSPGIPGKDNEGNTSNAGFVITDEGVIVFDALGTPSLGWALLQRIRQITDKPVRYVVVSHYHADHIYGLQAFKDHSGAAIVAQERSTEYKENDDSADEKAAQRLAQRREALAPWVNPQTRVVPADIVFSERLTLKLGERRFVLLYAGAAHSSNDVMMMVEPDGVLFAGDVVQNSRIPFMNADDVSTANWFRRLNDIEKLNPKFIIPGHGGGSNAAKDAIAFTLRYIDYVRSAMQRAADSWTDFETAYQQVDWSEYRQLPGFSNNNKGNAYRVFLELEQSQLEQKGR